MPHAMSSRLTVIASLVTNTEPSMSSRWRRRWKQRALDSAVIGVSRRGCFKGEAVGDPKRGQQPFRILLRDGKGKESVEEADVVLDCTGTYGQPRRLGDGGLPAIGGTAATPNIVYHLEDVVGARKNYYAGKTTVVVGSGYSAATLVCALVDLAEQVPETWVIWLARGSRTQPIQRVGGRLAARARSIGSSGQLAGDARREGTSNFIPSRCSR